MPLFRGYATIETEVFLMGKRIDKNGHLIGDDGVYENVKIKQATAFIFFCRIITAALAVLGALAMFEGTR